VSAILSSDGQFYHLSAVSPHTCEECLSPRWRSFVCT